MIQYTAAAVCVAEAAATVVADVDAATAAALTARIHLLLCDKLMPKFTHL